MQQSASLSVCVAWESRGHGGEVSAPRGRYLHQQPSLRRRDGVCRRRRRPPWHRRRRRRRFRGFMQARVIAIHSACPSALDLPHDVLQFDYYIHTLMGSIIPTALALLC